MWLKAYSAYHSNVFLHVLMLPLLVAYKAIRILKLMRFSVRIFLTSAEFFGEGHRIHDEGDEETDRWNVRRTNLC